ncbi:hypothetical protein KYI10_07760 [Macrococcus psychrotolerans]|uniref:Uncharacterized protein n=1 Tax=Macrococcus psychrotolerans TaxID=3039389 RepID=A0AAT9P5R4_9STAP|nr:hypothetical protein [Macrococcus sp. 19Msa1099]QYA32279.1 hypothetical protein KYI10_07760 [Macrococcus sp. 19Msa1099]
MRSEDMRLLTVLALQGLITLAALVISLIYCMAVNSSIDPLTLTITIIFLLMLIIYGGTDAGKLLQDK